MALGHYFVRSLFFLSLSHPTQAEPANSIISVPLENVKLISPADLPSAVLHQQHVNWGVCRLALMTGGPCPSDSDLWFRISDRLHGMAKDSEFMRKGHDGIVRSAQGVNSSQVDVGYPDSLALDIQFNDNAYVGKVQIGTPPKEYSLLMDSGSADFWVGGEGCRGTEGKNCGRNNLLGPNSSSTFEDLHESWSIGYRTGEVSGTMVRDDISVAGLRVKGLTFGVAQTESVEFVGDGIIFDGLAGLAKSILSSQRTITLVDALRKSGAIRSSIVSLKISRLADNKHDGEMTLGGMNPAKYDAKAIVTVKNLNKFGYWETAINQVKMNGRPIGWNNRTGVLDTGTALLVAPQEDVDILHSQITGAKRINGSWTVPCTSKTSLSLTIGNIDFPIDPRDIAFIPLDANNTRADCWSGIVAGTIPPFHLSTTWLLGDTFLKNVYHSMNGDKDEITFAKLK